MERKLLRLTELKSTGNDEEMTFIGYASTFGNTDAYGDVILAGAFAKSVDEAKQKGAWPALLSQHGQESMTPIGVITDLYEDEKGLVIECKLASTPRGLENYTLMKMTPRPAIDGLSIAFTMSRDDISIKGGIRHITNLKLHEVSLVTFPANDPARVFEVRSVGDFTEREFEKTLRDAGFSSKEAKIVISKGFRALKQSERDAGQDESNDAIIKALQASIATLKS